MRITHIETIPIRVPILERFVIRGAAGVHAESPFLLVRIHTDQGISGLGEVSATPRWSGEDQVTAAHFIRSILAPLLQGQDPRDVERLSIVIRRAIAGNPFTKAAVEMALWDILGKATGMPLYRLWGGAVRDSIATKWSVSGVEPDKAAAIAAWAVEQGYRTIKVKVGISPDGDLARVRAVREAAGPQVRIGVDANGGWPVSTALEMIPRLRDLGVYFIEQPVAPSDFEWMAEVKRASPLPVIADESVYTPHDAMALARARAADVFSIYVGKSGGLGQARKIAVVAESAGIACTIGSNLELGVASAAMIHLGLASAALDPDRFPCDIIGPFYYEAGILAEPLPLVHGRASKIERPGLGVVLDDGVVARYASE